MNTHCLAARGVVGGARAAEGRTIRIGYAAISADNQPFANGAIAATACGAETPERRGGERDYRSVERRALRIAF